MNKNKVNENRKKMDTGMYMVLGTAFGITIGQVFLDGNIALGISFGMMGGLIVGLIAERQRPVYTVAGIVLGVVLGALLGVLAGQVVPGGMGFVGAVVLGALGFIAGSLMDRQRGNL